MTATLERLVWTANGLQRQDKEPVSATAIGAPLILTLERYLGREDVLRDEEVAGALKNAEGATAYVLGNTNPNRTPRSYETPVQFYKGVISQPI